MIFKFKTKKVSYQRRFLQDLWFAFLNRSVKASHINEMSFYGHEMERVLNLLKELDNA